jgi:hypothetical protein
MPKTRSTRDKQSTEQPTEELLSGVMQELREMRREMDELRARQDTRQGQQPHLAASNEAHAPVATTSADDSPSLLAPDRNPVLLQRAVPSSELPEIDIVPKNIRKDILRGKDVNMAILLLPIRDRQTYTADKDLQLGDEVITLKARGDNRLKRDLTIMEFIKAFTVYKRIMCAEYRDRTEELDKYLTFIIEISQKFPGTCFYRYHLHFAAKAALYLEEGQRIDWAVPDSTMLSTIIAGQKANVCNLCQAPDHTAVFCGLNADKPYAPPRGAWNPQQRSAGRPRPCRFFQDRGCVKTDCGYQHVCDKCFSRDHGSSSPACRQHSKQ